MDNKFISVKVSGNPAPNGGFGPLIMFNNPRFELKDVFYGGFESNSYYFSICIDQSQVVYKIIKNNVRSHGAIRAGALSLAFSIPKGYKVDGYTPYEVLMGLLDTFLKNCMTCRDEQAGTYEFNDVRVPLDALDETAKKYRLTEYESPWHTMSDDTRIGCIQADEIQIEQLINDVQYDEFEKYSEVLIAEIVGDNCTFNRITGLEIPRRPVYTIYVDGNLYQKTNEVDKPVTIESMVDSRYYEWKPKSFTISDLLNGDCVEGVTFNGIAEIINVSTASYKHPKEFKIRVVFTPSENEAAIYSHKGQITIKYSGQKVFLDKDYMFKLKGDEYEQLSHLNLFKVTAPESLDIEFDAEPTFDSKKNELQWKTKKKEKQKPIDTDTVSLPATRDDKHKPETHSSDVFKLVFDIEDSDANKTIIESINKGVESKIVVRNEASGETVSKDKLILSLDTTISQGKGKKGKSNASNKRTYLKDEIRIPKPSSYQNKYEVGLYVGKKVFKTNFDYSEGKYVDGCWVVKFSDFKQVRKPITIKDVIFKPNRKLAFIEGFLLCALLVGGSMIIKSCFGNGNKTPKEPNPKEIASDSVENSANDTVEMTDEVIYNFLNKSDSILKEEKLSFAEVDKIYDEYNSKDIDRCKNINVAICKRIEDYKKVATFISKHQYEDIRDNIDKMDLHPVHNRFVKLITNGVLPKIKGYNAHDYKTQSDRKKARNLFENNTFNSFSGLLKIAEEYKKEASTTTVTTTTVTTTTGSNTKSSTEKIPEK